MVSWRRPRVRPLSTFRRFYTALRHRVEDEGDWFFSSEWWGAYSDGQTVLRSTSDQGNGVVSVLSYPSSRPYEIQWPETEKWLQRRYAEIHSGHEDGDSIRILGYQWRTLRFNDDTRQSTAKVMAAYRESEPGSVFLMQQPHCLAVPYVRSMVSVGLASIASSDCDLMKAIQGKETMHVLCIGHGGGSLPLFLASKIQGAIVHIVEIDPLVISASIQSMGFPSYAVIAPSGVRALPMPSTMDEVLWKGIHERLYLYESDAEKFVLETTNLYDLIFIDAYDGDDVFPHKLWDPSFPFLKALSDCLDPGHGTVVVNLHSDYDILDSGNSASYFCQTHLPMGKYVGKVCRAYKDSLLGNGSYCGGGKEGHGMAFTVAVPWVCNTSLVVCRGLGRGNSYGSKDNIADTVTSKSLEVENMLNLPFSCLQFIKRGFVLVD